MFESKAAFGSFSVSDLQEAKKFYADTLGLELTDETMGLQFKLPGGGSIFIYEKADHQPATYTMLNFVVQDIDDAMETLHANGIQFEHYKNMPQDEKGVLRGLASNMGPDIAWFKDPADNILAVLQDKK